MSRQIWSQFFDEEEENPAESSPELADFANKFMDRFSFTKATVGVYRDKDFTKTVNEVMVATGVAKMDPDANVVRVPLINVIHNRSCVETTVNPLFEACRQPITFPKAHIPEVALCTSAFLRNIADPIKAYQQIGSIVQEASKVCYKNDLVKKNVLRYDRRSAIYEGWTSVFSQFMVPSPSVLLVTDGDPKVAMVRLLLALKVNDARIVVVSPYETQYPYELRAETAFLKFAPEYFLAEKDIPNAWKFDFIVSHVFFNAKCERDREAIVDRSWKLKPTGHHFIEYLPLELLLDPVAAALRGYTVLKDDNDILTIHDICEGKPYEVRCVKAEEFVPNGCFDVTFMHGRSVNNETSLSKGVTKFFCFAVAVVSVSLDQNAFVLYPEEVKTKGVSLGEYPLLINHCRPGNHNDYKYFFVREKRDYYFSKKLDGSTVLCYVSFEEQVAYFYWKKFGEWVLKCARKCRATANFVFQMELVDETYYIVEILQIGHIAYWAKCFYSRLKELSLLETNVLKQEYMVACPDVNAEGIVFNNSFSNTSFKLEGINVGTSFHLKFALDATVIGPNGFVDISLYPCLRLIKSRSDKNKVSFPLVQPFTFDEILDVIKERSEDILFSHPRDSVVWSLIIKDYMLGLPIDHAFYKEFMFAAYCPHKFNLSCFRCNVRNLGNPEQTDRSVIACVKDLFYSNKWKDSRASNPTIVKLLGTTFPWVLSKATKRTKSIDSDIPWNNIGLLESSSKFKTSFPDGLR